MYSDLSQDIQAGTTKYVVFKEFLMGTPLSPAVSVIIPTFNSDYCIPVAIQSVLDQTYKNFEIIVVDDGSTDSTRATLDPWIKDGTIRYYYQNNKGAAAARNLGISLAKGEFLKFLDADDFLYPKQLELQVHQLEDKDDSIISVTDYEFEFESKFRKQFKTWIGKSSQLARLIQGNIAPPHCVLVRRTLVEKVKGYDEGLSSCQDTDLWLRIVIQGGIFERMEYIGCCYRVVPGSVSSNPDKQIMNRCRVFEKLNRTLFPQLDTLPSDVLGQLFSTNTRLIHVCLKRKIKPDLCLSEALRSCEVIYPRKGWKQKVMLRTLGIQNIMYLKYIRSCLMKKNYFAHLDISAHRDERSYL